MIEINPNLKLKCNECPMFEPKMNVQRAYADNKCYLTSVNISCDKAAMCDSLDNYLREVMGIGGTTRGKY